MAKSTMLKQIFTNKLISKKVHDTHFSIQTQYADLTLEEVLVVGPKWNREKIERLKNDGTLKKLIKFFYDWKYDDDEKSLTTAFPRLYNVVEIAGYARWRAEYMQRMNLIGYDLSSNRCIESLEDIALYGGDYTSVSYAIKCYLLANRTIKEIDEYKGLQPLTRPVQDAVKTLFGISESQYRHTIRCNLLSAEARKSPTFINTALWNMGF